MLIGAYMTTILSVDHGWNDLATIPLAGLIAGVVGFLFGFPALRLRGVYLALATFAIPIALIALAKKYSGLHRRRRRQAADARARRATRRT